MRARRLIALLCALAPESAARKKVQAVLTRDVAPKSMEGETPAWPCATSRSCGIAMVLFAEADSTWLGDRQVGGTDMLRELVLAVRVVRDAMAQNSYPMLLMANEAGRALLSTADAKLWDEHSELVLEPAVAALDETLDRKRRRRRKQLKEDGRLRVWLYRMQGLLLSPFERTLFLDGDMYVLDGDMVRTLLTRTLRLAELAMPLDPWRGGAWTLSAAPPLCASLLAARSHAPGVRDFVLGAMMRLVNGSHRHLHPDVQTGDQSMFWFEWVAAPLTPDRSSAVRVLPLPSEFFCPSEPVSTTHVLRGSQLALEPFAHFHTSWVGPLGSKRRGVYKCGAVHAHGYSEEPLRTRHISAAEVNERVRSASSRQKPAPSLAPASAEQGTEACGPIDRFEDPNIDHILLDVWDRHFMH